MTPLDTTPANPTPNAHGSLSVSADAVGRPMSEAPRDGTIVRLLIDWEGSEGWSPLTDAMQSWTIGGNSLDHTGDDFWQYVGWNWSQDCFIDLRTDEDAPMPIGWLPFDAAPPQQEAGPVVKALEWKRSANQYGVQYCAMSLFGYIHYISDRDRDGYPSDGWHSIHGDFDTIEAAQAAAQAEYERRVRRCLHPSPATADETLRLREENERLKREAEGEFVDAAIRVMRSNPGFEARDYAEGGISADDFEAFFTEDMNEAWRCVEEAQRRASRFEAGLKAIASHGNTGLTDGSEATRFCLDWMVKTARDHLSQPAPVVEDGKARKEAELLFALARGYESMFRELCFMAGTSGPDSSWYRKKASDLTARLSPLWKLTADSNPTLPGECLSHYRTVCEKIATLAPEGQNAEASLREAFSGSFITANSGEGRPFIKAEFANLKAMQTAHSALIAALGAKP